LIMSVKALRKLFDKKDGNVERSKSPLAGAFNRFRGKGTREEAVALTQKSFPAHNNQTATSAIYWLDQQDHTGTARGWAPFANDPTIYPVYRNVAEYGAIGDGTGDQSASLQNALNADGTSGGNRYQQGVTTEPAIVYLPPGVYQVSKTIDLRMGTVIIGDPGSPPTIKAAPGFQGDTVVNGYDYATGHPETSFMTLLKNVIIDTTNLPKDTTVTALRWAVAQGCALTNVSINMPTHSSGHTGILLNGGSTIALCDVSISGGAVGIGTSNQQVNLKNIYFKNCTTAFLGSGGFTALLQGATFETCGAGAQMTNTLGCVVLLDCNSINSGPTVVLQPTDPSWRNNQVVIENLTTDQANPVVVIAGGPPLLGPSRTIDTWVYGNAEPGWYQAGTSYATQRTSALLSSDGKFFTKIQPIYAGVSASNIVNVKTVPGLPVYGDSRTDDAASLNSILQQNAATGKITFFPYGVYLVRETLLIPPGSRLVGEAWSVISGAGSNFADAANPVPVVKVGNPGDIGICEISEMRFTVSEVLPGAIICEINMAGQPGDVGLWNTIITIGGIRDTQVSSTCQNQDTSNCKAAFLALHITSSSSVYLENIWGWCADHYIDSASTFPGDQIISSGRGLLCEATKGTWLVGTGFEHHWLYNYNFHNAANVFAGLLQAETPYMQGQGAVLTVPAPWTPDSRFGDPDYSWCAAGDQMGRTALACNVDGGSDLFFYNGAFWAFFNGPWSAQKWSQTESTTIQTNMVRVANSPRNLVWYGVGTKGCVTMVLDDLGNLQQSMAPGGWGGNLAAYRAFAA
jgi:glucan 1,3-beta-glucosidase